ncbi:MAG: helicase-exonuclease AddAB subunit AddA [Firmicutes bacterium]|nr:helicase-exonuclease AddAB subunit AddA [Bacillota bacterium]
MNWTQAQQQTIDERGVNILVSAAAGSGKTTVLIERIKQLVLRDRVDIDRFLITTFTRAAASEMKEKLEDAIGKALENAETEEDREYLQRQAALLPQAMIGTFHSFATTIIREYFFLTELQPGFSIGDEVRGNILKRESVDELFEVRFEDDRERFMDFLRTYSGDRSDDRLKENILGIHKELCSIPDYWDWARETTDKLGSASPVRELKLDRFLLQEAVAIMRKAAREYGRAAKLLDDPKTAGLFAKASQDADMIRALAEEAAQRADDPDALSRLLELSQLLSGLSLNRMSAGKEEKDAWERVKKQVTSWRGKGKKSLDKIRQRYTASASEEWDGILRGLEEDTRYYLDLVRGMEEIYNEKKQAENIIDFDDVLHYALRILKDDKAAADYRGRFEFIFIDEYQDSNLLQERIVERICRENNLFMVGDVKQSIYKFRLAEPEIFRDRYRRYREGKDEQSIKIDLNNNFRSKKTIRDGVNEIFTAVMEGYDEDARLYGDDENEHRGEPVCLHILDRSESERTEPELVAEIIRQQVGKTIYDKDGNPRPLEYGDIAVLSRGRNDIAALERYLNNEGIPAYGQTDGGYYETVEIEVFLNLLRVISNLRQDVPLISVMSAVFFDFHPAELAAVRIAFPRGSYCQAVMNYAEKGADENLREKIRGMLEQIALWRQISWTVPLDELIRMLMHETGYYDYCSSLPVGRQRISNLRLLMDRAAAFEETGYTGLHGFLTYVEAMKRTRQKVSEASVVGEGEKVVRVMTVHKSKGLEFPMVILTGAGRSVNGSRAGKQPAVHKQFALGLPQVDREMHWSGKTILQRAIAGKKTQEDVEEEIRILYVALTRPKDALHIVGSVSSMDKLDVEWDTGSFLEMVYGTLLEMAVADPSAARVIIHGGDEEAAGEAQRQFRPGKTTLLDAADEEPEDISLAEEVDRRLSYRYPYEEQMAVRPKYSVTELNRTVEEAGMQPPAIPPIRDLVAEEEGEELTAAQIGSAMHAIMERVDFARARDEGMDYIRAAAEEMTEQGILTEEELAAASLENIAAFFRDPVGLRAAGAETLHREKEFLMRKEEQGVPVVVQGIIDCWFAEDDGLVLIDYKNSRLGGEADEQVIADRYREQIRLYREALEKAEERPVKESWLYLFRAKRFIPID